MPRRILDADVDDAASFFLHRYNRDGHIPVPIESIVEFDLGIEIIPLPCLERDCDMCASITQDLSRIYVDDKTLRNNAGRYRFSLAHEVAHRALHASVFQSASFIDVAGWKSHVCDKFGEEEYAAMERECNSFAAMILMPAANLAAALATAKHEALIAVPVDNGNDRKAWIQQNLAARFQVNEEPIRIRMTANNLLI